MAVVAEAKPDDISRAVELAKDAVDLASEEASFWNNLGLAYYRAGDFPAAIKALNKSMELSNGGTAFDWIFLAMTHHRLGEPSQARAWHDKAIAWMNSRHTEDEELLRFRAEAAQLLGIPQTQPSTVPATRAKGEREGSGKDDRRQGGRRR